MRRAIPAAIFAVALAAVPIAAQQKSTASSTSRTDPKSVLLSGCLTGGSSSYTLSNVSISRSAHESAPDRAVGTSGASTSYSVIARDGVDLGDYIGKKVEVTGTLMPATSPPATAEPRKEKANPDM